MNKTCTDCKEQFSTNYHFRQCQWCREYREWCKAKNTLDSLPRHDLWLDTASQKLSQKHGKYHCVFSSNTHNKKVTFTY